MTIQSARPLLLLIAATLLTARPTVAQNDYTAAEIEEGGRMFVTNCAQCHGVEGEAVPGVDLGHGQFRRATLDEELVQIVRNGIPGTAMPATNISWEMAGVLVGYLRSLDVTRAAVPGDPVKGQVIFEEKGHCQQCHRVNGIGSRVGPNLSDIGMFRRASELERALLEPGADIRPANRSVRVVTREGTSVSGRLLNHDTWTLQLIDSNEQLRTFLKPDLRNWSFIETSSMPSARGRLSSDELTDLVKYLTSLRGLRSSQP
jgi:putative heme-binding domain-containing protein